MAVPHRYKGSEQHLGEWVKNVRRGIKQISVAERKQLNALGFVWETKYNRWDREWKEMLDKLRAYKQRFGDCYVPWQWSEDKKLAEVSFGKKSVHGGRQYEERSFCPQFIFSAAILLAFSTTSGFIHSGKTTKRTNYALIASKC